MRTQACWSKTSLAPAPMLPSGHPFAFDVERDRDLMPCLPLAALFRQLSPPRRLRIHYEERDLAFTCNQLLVTAGGERSIGLVFKPGSVFPKFPFSFAGRG
jgi:hypothetical protein